MGSQLSYSWEEGRCRHGDQKSAVGSQRVSKRAAGLQEDGALAQWEMNGGADRVQVRFPESLCQGCAREPMHEVLLCKQLATQTCVFSRHTMLKAYIVDVCIDEWP